MRYSPSSRLRQGHAHGDVAYAFECASVPRGRLRLLVFIMALKRGGIEQQAYVSIEGERLR